MLSATVSVLGLVRKRVVRGVGCSLLLTPRWGGPDSVLECSHGVVVEGQVVGLGASDRLECRERVA